MSFRQWVDVHRDKAVRVDSCGWTTRITQVAHGPLQRISADNLVIGPGRYVRISQIARVRLNPDESLACSVIDTFRCSYDDPAEPAANHRGQPCPIHDEAPWRLWRYQLERGARPGIMIVELIDEVGLCGCGSIATVRVEFYSPRGVFSRSALRCDRCARRTTRAGARRSARRPQVRLRARFPWRAN